MDYNKRIEKLEISKLGLSVKAYNELRRKNIKTVGDFFEAVNDNTVRMGQSKKPMDKTAVEVFAAIRDYEEGAGYNYDKKEQILFHGKEKCKKLKQIRKLIAEVNNIPFETVECYHEGPCPGTCPACDAEIKYLDEQLQQKIRRGENVILSGLAVDMVDSPRDGNGINKDISADVSSVDGRRTPVIYATMGQDVETPFNDKKDDDDDDQEELVMGKIEMKNPPLSKKSSHSKFNKENEN